MEKENESKPKAVIVGGSIAGISFAHALLRAGWEVMVVEKSASPPQASSTGAGVGLDPLSGRIIQSWLRQPELYLRATSPLTIDQVCLFTNRTTSDFDGTESQTEFLSCPVSDLLQHRTKPLTETVRILARDESMNFRAAHWADLHGLIYSGLTPDIFLWGHVFLSFTIPQDKTSVTVKAKAIPTESIVEIRGDLLVGADGSLSSIRRTFLPDLKLRYSGYCAWRGLLDYSGNEDSEIISGIRKAYPELGIGLEVIVYYMNYQIKGSTGFGTSTYLSLRPSSITSKASITAVEYMHREAEKVWLPEFVKVMKETKEPFLNTIYDCDPPGKVFWDNVVLVGDAARPTIPNGAQSTNMSISDAALPAEVGC